ncbi:MAG TPA: hypothetical protein VME42_09485 [Steroidobacteraceae bacterium]|nr:hypothetical protein [Steroidobacteraceae bacterium]
MLIAPCYPPAVAFEQPVSAPYVLSLETASLADLMSVPAAWAIVLRHLPSLQPIVSAPMMKPHLGNFTVHSLAAFMPGAKPEVYAAIDEELARLPQAAEPRR